MKNLIQETKNKLAIKNSLLVFIAFIITSFAANAQYAKLYDFIDTATGFNPTGSLISDGTFFYGTTNNGGTKNMGTVFKIKPDGTGLTKLLDFTGTTNGRIPCGLLKSDSDYIYGMTRRGGTKDSGTIYKIKTDGTRYMKLLDFNGSGNGACPSQYASLIFDGSFLYGMTVNGGSKNSGIIFKIKPDGSNYAILSECSDSSKGYYPYGTLVLDSQYLYGTTYSGGKYGKGIIYRVKTDGSDFTNLSETFPDSNGYGANLVGGLTLVGNFLYGIAVPRIFGYYGWIYKIKKDGSSFQWLNNQIYNPSRSLIYDGTFLYGMTGTSIFQIKPDGSGNIEYPNKLSDLSISADLPLYTGGYFYGMTLGDGANNKGSIFKFKTYNTGINELSNKEELTIYPNPNNGKLNIQLNASNSLICKLGIYNILGEKVYSDSKFNTISSTEIDLSNEAKGIYIISISDGVSNYKQKFVVQ